MYTEFGLEILISHWPTVKHVHVFFFKHLSPKVTAVFTEHLVKVKIRGDSHFVSCTLGQNQTRWR